MAILVALEMDFPLVPDEDYTSRVIEVGILLKSRITNSEIITQNNLEDLVELLKPPGVGGKVYIVELLSIKNFNTSRVAFLLTQILTFERKLDIEVILVGPPIKYLDKRITYQIDNIWSWDKDNKVISRRVY